MVWAPIMVCSVALVLYVLFGYPLILGWLARMAPKPLHKGNGLKTVSVVIPVHDGAEFLREKLTSVIGQDYPRDLMEVRVVSDGSTDETEAIASEFRPQGIHLASIPKSGKAAAINMGIGLAT